MFPYIYNTFWITDDKTLHMFWGLIIFLFCIFFFNILKKKTIIYSFLVVFIIALGKEVYDSFVINHYVEFLDVVFTLVGAIIGLLLYKVYLLIRK